MRRGSLTEEGKAIPSSVLPWVKEHPARYPASREMIVDLLGDHKTIIRQLREDVQMTVEKYHDVGTSDLLTGILEQHERISWMLRANLEGQSK